MTLLYLAVAYLAGIAAGQFLWQQGLFGCGIGDGYWIAALAPVPVCLWMDAAGVAKVATPLRWPMSAGFAVPRTSLSAWLMGGLLLAGLCGILRLASHPPLPCLEPTDLAYYNADERENASQRPVQVDGYVVGYPVRKEGRQRMDVEATAVWLYGEPQPVSGRVRVQTSSRHPFRYGEAVRASGLLTQPPVFEDFDYRSYLARKQVHSLMLRPRVEPQPGPPRGGTLLQLVYALRARSEALLNRRLPEPFAALANGMLLGIEAGIPDDLYEQFNRTGTSHVIVISGSNVALVSGMLMALGIKLFGRRAALWPTLGWACLLHAAGGRRRGGHAGGADGRTLRAGDRLGPAEHSTGQPGRGLLGHDAVESSHALGCGLSAQRRGHGRPDPDRAAAHRTRRGHGSHCGRLVSTTTLARRGDAGVHFSYARFNQGSHSG